MKARINGQEMGSHFLYFQPMNYGQQDHGAIEVPYELSVSLSVFQDALKKFYEDYAEDDRTYGKQNESPVILKLRSLDWPPLSFLAGYEKNLLSAFVKEHLNYLVLMGIFAIDWHRVGEPRYYINSIDSVTVTNDAITLKGVALS